MTSALYLEHYLDGLENLPNELKRNFTLMRELDTRAQTLMKQIDEKSKVLMSTMIQPEKANELLKNPNNIEDEKVSSSIKVIQDLFNKAKEYGDDKVQLAIQTYELVDKHIRRLDSDLARFEGEIQDKNVSTQGKTEEVLGKKGRKKTKDAKVSGKKTGKRSLSDEDEKVTGEKSSAGTQNKSSSKKNKVNQEKEGRKNQKKKDDSEELQAEGHLTPHPSDVLDMPVDPNEPTYCLCHQVSYGEMIGCDNPDCPIEWFHFACVGLTIKPRGKWYCYGCLNKKK